MARNRLQTYQLKVTLEEIRPPIWRRILVPGNTTLLKLHDILQIVMGWRDYHLHLFMIAGEEYGDPGLDEFGDWPLKNEARYKLSQLIPGEGFRFHYEYDFGDSWRHLLLVEKILPAGPDARQPLCLKGKRACPPEDVGGAWGYEGFLEALRDPGHSEHEVFLEWVGGEFDPEAFDLDKVNDVLRRMGVGRSTAALSPWPSEVVETDFFDAPPAWLAGFPDADRATAEALPLRRDVITLLTYLRDNRVTGTQATGNLPLKAVREITRQFVEPPILEHRIGDQVFAVRSEMEVWPLQFVHVLAAIGGLVIGWPGPALAAHRAGGALPGGPGPVPGGLLVGHLVAAHQLGDSQPVRDHGQLSFGCFSWTHAPGTARGRGGNPGAVRTFRRPARRAHRTNLVRTR
jgi:hypothetical protein